VLHRVPIDNDLGAATNGYGVILNQSSRCSNTNEAGLVSFLADFYCEVLASDITGSQLG
jgi:hypothetical protein